MKRIFISLAMVAALCSGAPEASAQFNVGKAVNGLSKGVKALTLTDA